MNLLCIRKKQMQSLLVKLKNHQMIDANSEHECSYIHRNYVFSIDMMARQAYIRSDVKGQARQGCDHGSSSFSNYPLPNRRMDQSETTPNIGRMKSFIFTSFGKSVKPNTNIRRTILELNCFAQSIYSLISGERHLASM